MITLPLPSQSDAVSCARTAFSLLTLTDTSMEGRNRMGDREITFSSLPLSLSLLLLLFLRRVYEHSLTLPVPLSCSPSPADDRKSMCKRDR